MDKPRVLFVDDEPRILDGLRRSLRAQRAKWEMTFAGSGAEALEVLAATRHDVVVSDMRMPGMDGAELLAEVSHRHPEVARAVLSGHSEPDATMRAAIAGHRFLSKPTEAEALSAVIEQLTPGTPTDHGAEVRRVACAATALPVLPRLLQDLHTAIDDADADPAGLTTAVVRTPGLIAKLLQVSNSAFFGAKSRNASVLAAVNTLGTPTVHALGRAMIRQWDGVSWEPEIEAYVETAWRHAMATAALIESVASPAHRPYAQAAALIQHVGELAWLASTKQAHDAGPDAGELTSVPVRSRAVGAELLRLWGLPAPIVTAVAERDSTHRPTAAGLGVGGALRAAHLLIRQTESSDPENGANREELAELLSHPQLTARSADWERLAEEASARATGQLAS